MKTNKTTKGLAIAGTVFVFLPIVLPIFFGLTRIVRGARFILDWLMPAELLPLVLIGAALLTWAALRAKMFRRWIILSIVIGLLLLGIGLTYATVTGMADGSVNPTTGMKVFAYGCVMLFDVGVLLTGIGGVLLLRRLYRHTLPVESQEGF